MENKTSESLLGFTSSENEVMNNRKYVGRDVPSWRLGFTSLENEVINNQLPLIGGIPPWLTGTLIRNGPAKLEVGNQGYRHWFEGLAMLHKFSFKNGQVCYTNRFLQSNAYKKAMETGKISYSEFATDPCRSIFSRVHSMFSPKFTDNANVNVTRIGRRFIAMTETPLPVEFDPQTLKTVGVLDGGGDRVSGHLTTAHPHYDFTRMQAVNFITRFSRKSTYNIYGIPSGTTEKKLIGSIQVDEPAYMHSFGMTENYVILVEYPLVVQLSDLLLRGKPFIENFQWKRERGTRFIIMDIRTGRLAGEKYQAVPFFAFHHVNAFERGDEVILDIIAYKDSSIISSLYLDILNGKSPGEVSSKGELRRYYIPMQGSEINYEVISKDALELPRINYRQYNTKDYRFLYAVGTISSDDYGKGTPIVKVDIKERKSKVWSENGCYSGEPVFVARPDGVAEDDGIILSVILNSKKANSFLLVLDAQSFQEIARAEAPHHIPFGFHG